MLDLRRQLLEFSRYHRCAYNRLCHYIGLPSIAVAVLGCLAYLDWDLTVAGWRAELDAAQCLLIVTLLLDLCLNWRIAIGVFLAGVAAYTLGSALPVPALLALFVSGWGLQVIGHRRIEGNNPAFLTNLVHLLVGPRWLVNRVIRALPEDEPLSRS